MSTYKGIQGFSIQNLSADPSNFDVGQVWYNSTDQVFKVTLSGTDVPDSWATGGTMGTARYNLGSASAGTQNAALGFGGWTGSPGTESTATEEYNGSSWTAGGALPVAKRAPMGAGTQTAGLSAGGVLPPYANTTEEYNGSTWTAGGNLASGRGYGAACGTQTAGLIFCGNPSPNRNTTEEYDGSSWTAGGNLGTPREFNAGAGTQTAALTMGGNIPGIATTEEYNGTSWTAGGNLGTARYTAAGAGIQTAALLAGGTGDTDGTELYDGTSWTTSANMSLARKYFGAAGSQAEAIAFATQSPISGSTEEFTLGSPAIRTITTT